MNIHRIPTDERVRLIRVASSVRQLLGLEGGVSYDGHSFDIEWDEAYAALARLRELNRLMPAALALIEAADDVVGIRMLSCPDCCSSVSGSGRVVHSDGCSLRRLEEALTQYHCESAEEVS